MKQQLLQQLGNYGQEHLLAFWDQLTPEAREGLARQIEEIDFELIDRVFRSAEGDVDWSELAAKAESPPAFRLNDEGARFSAAEAGRRGAEALCGGKVGMILVAGGQGTRLGFDHPKGMFPLGPVSSRSLCGQT